MLVGSRRILFFPPAFFFYLLRGNGNSFFSFSTPLSSCFLLRIFLGICLSPIVSLKAWRGELSDKVVSFAGGGMG
jgi:hypothetical protein